MCEDFWLTIIDFRMIQANENNWTWERLPKLKFQIEESTKDGSPTLRDWRKDKELAKETNRAVERKKETVVQKAKKKESKWRM